MAQSIYALSSAMFSFSQMQTIHSVKTQIEGRNGVLTAEIESGNGDIEGKKKELAENEKKSNRLTGNMYESMADINQKLNEAEPPEKTGEASVEMGMDKSDGTGRKEDRYDDGEQSIEVAKDTLEGLDLSDMAVSDTTTYNAFGQVSSGMARVGAIMNLAI